MGAKGLRATLGILLGGVAQTVVEYANWPVLVVRAPFEGLHKVLLVSELAGRHEEIADPYGGPIEGYVATAAQLDVLIKLGLPRLFERIGITSKAK